MKIGKINLHIDLVKQMSKKEFVKMFDSRFNAEEVYNKINPPKKKKDVEKED